MDVALSAHAAYELWSQTYPPIAHNPLMRVEQDVVERLIVYQRATRALDVGTGSGRYLPLPARASSSAWTFRARCWRGARARPAGGSCRRMRADCRFAARRSI
jgi:hypothetical protein